MRGTYGAFIPNVGGWDPTWDAPRKIYNLRPWKGHKRERTREERFQKIETAMKEQPAKLEKYRQDILANKPKKDLFYQFKRVMRIANLKGTDVKKKVTVNKKNQANKKKK